MHEFVLAQNLIDEVKFALNNHESSKLVKVVVGFGPFTHATFDRVEFWWNTLLTGTNLEGAQLIKQELDGKLFCPNCNKEFLIKEKSLQQYDEYLELFSCPECNSFQTKIIEGTDIILLHLEIKVIENINN